MTQDEWLTTTDVNAMFRALPETRDRRRWTLFTCACCRMLGDKLGPWATKIIEAYESEADGGPTVPDFHAQDFWNAPPDVDSRITALMGRVREGALGRILWLIGLELGYPNMDYSPFAPVVRCLFDHPFRPIARRPSEAITALAEAPGTDVVLADAIEEAGELAAAAHLRTGPHFRGCHVREWARQT